MRFEHLDAEQLRAIDAIGASIGKILVLGGAGTGKTTTALWAARRYLDDEGAKNRARVLFLTFSRSAVKEITVRSPGVLGDRQERIEVMTFHGLCHWLIRTFGRYAGFGTDDVEIQSESRVKLRGRDQSRLSYNDLIPGATKILRDSNRVREIISARWGLVICDEAQDTSNAQWRLIDLLSPKNTLMLGDMNQMIYAYLPGVSVEQFEAIRSSADLEISLKPRSHRDPSGLIPAVAAAVLDRDFGNQAVVDAIQKNRLRVYFDTTADERDRIIADEIDVARKLGMSDLGIFANHNDTVSDLGAMLNKHGIDHALMGISEAHAEALNAMATQCGYAVGTNTEEDVDESLAFFLNACVRGSDPPIMAKTLIRGVGLPDRISSALRDLKDALRAASDGSVAELTEVVVRSWGGLGFAQGFRPWQRAARHFMRVAYRWRDLSAYEDTISDLKRAIAGSYSESIIDMEFAEVSRVKLMTYNQTKGREADQTIHVFTQEDFFGFGREPFIDESRKLYVAISRARKRVVVILPPNPHALVGPYETLRKVQDAALVDEKFELTNVDGSSVFP